MPWVRWERIARPKALGGWGLKNVFLFSKALVGKVVWRLISTTSLWTTVIHKKYIAPLTLLDWIRIDNKRRSGVSIIWKAIVQSFDLIGKGLAWSIGNGRKFLVGRVPWAGGDRYHLLLEELYATLEHRIYTFLYQVADPNTTSIWNQGWVDGGGLGLSGDLQMEWDAYIRALKLAHIRLTTREDGLVWDSHPSGHYTPKAGYIKLTYDRVPGIQFWWWRQIWKFKCPSKSKLFLWTALTNTVSTWDNLQKRIFNNPGWCALCGNAW